MNIDFPYHSTAAAAPRDDRRRPHPRPHRAAAVHLAGRTCKPADLRQRRCSSSCSPPTATRSPPPPSSPSRARSSNGSATSSRSTRCRVETRLDPPARGPLRRAPHRRDARSPRSRVMAGLPYLCCATAPRDAAQRPDLNGIDFLEVADLDQIKLDPTRPPSTPPCPSTERDRLLWERRLELFFVNPLLPRSGEPHRRQFRDQGRRAAGIHRRPTFLASAPKSLVLRASKRGDFSTYTLAVGTPGDPAVSAAGLDPLPRPSTSRSRSSARAISTAAAARLPAAAVAPAGARLPREGLRQLPPADARPHRALAPTGASAMPPTSASRSSNCSPMRRPPELPPGRGRHRGLSRHGAPARFGPPPCAAPRLPHARRLQRARLGAGAGRC